MKATAAARPTKREVAHATRLRASATADQDPATRSVAPATRFSIPKLEGMLDALATKAKILNPHGKGESIAAWCASAKEAINTGEWLKEKGEIAVSASRGDEQAISLLAEAVEITTSNFLAANANWLRFFEQRSLGETEFPVMTHEQVGMRMFVDSIGQDGGNETIQSQVNQPSPLFIPLHMRSTKWIEYPLRDAYHGTAVREAALSQFDLARDRAWRTNELLGGYMIVGGANTRLTATFETASADLGLRDYYPMPGVVASNLPVGNFITIAGNTTSSLFRKEVFDAIIKYTAAWGGDLTDGEISPVEILIASGHMTDFLGQVSLSSDGTNPLNQQIFQGGMVVSYAGRNWIITGDNTIDPNQGVAYVRTDKPVGIYFDKPNLAETIVDETPALRQQNKGRSCEIFCEGFGMPRHWRKFTLGVRYKTPV
jgi:hypothetical protein